MNWIEKIKYLLKMEKNKEEGDSFFYDIYHKGNMWDVHEIDDLLIKYPWLPKEYISFICEFDTIGIAFCRFYGSKERKVFPLVQIIEETKPYLKDNYFPFGCSADGSHFLMNQVGQIFWWDKYDYDFEQEPEFLANSLEEFVDQFLLGPRYGAFADLENNHFYLFLKSMNWA